jgi:hypothetical protein
MYAQIAASGNSANIASAMASRRSPPPDEVTMSNQASQTSIVPVAAASATSQRGRRRAVHAVAANATANAMSNPIQATS